MGGTSAERAVSLRSGAAVANGLRAAGYEAVEVDIRNRGIRLIPRDVDLVFVALHGEFGEDGRVQRMLERAGLPYTGSGPAASEASFDKRLTKELLEKAGVPTPRYEILRRGRKPALALPAVVKPTRQGSSIGVNRVLRKSRWRAALTDAFRYGNEVLVEGYVKGRELTVGVVGDLALPVVEVVAPNGWYDYRAKYTKGLTRYLVPAALDARTAARCQELALATFRALGCRGFGRIDFRMTAEQELYVLELNNIPGFTETSLLPKAAAAAGIGFAELCDRIVKLALV